MRINDKIIRSKMAENEITNRALAAMLGVHENSVYYKLRGLTPWTVEEIAKIASTFNVPIGEIIIIEKAA